jgi:hypothetical protein
MSSAYKKALEKKKTSESVFDREVSSQSSSEDERQEDSDASSVQDAKEKLTAKAKEALKVATKEVEENENELRAFRDQDPASKEWKNR